MTLQNFIEERVGEFEKNYAELWDGEDDLYEEFRNWFRSSLQDLLAEVGKEIEKLGGRCDCPDHPLADISEYRNGDGVCNGCVRFVIEEGCACGMARIDDIKALLNPKK